MRAWMMAMAVLAGCLHAQTPAASPRHADPAVLSEFKRLLGDPDRIEDAADFAEAHHLSRAETSAAAAPAYAAFMRMEAYAFAAEIAWRFGFGQPAVGAPAAFQRGRAGKSAAEYLARRNDRDAAGFRVQAVSDLRDEALIGCFYSADPADGRAAVEDAIAFRAASFDDDVLFPLLTARCPVDASWRALIVDLAFSRGMDDYAIRHAAEADWAPEKRARFAWGFLSVQRCGAGSRAVAALRVPSADVVPMVETSECEQANISTKGWSLGASDAGSYFFAAVRKDRLNLALTLLPFTGFGADGQEYLFQEALRHGRGADLLKVLSYHPGYHEALMQYAFDHGRYRFVGTYAQTYAWEEKAFDKLIELRQYDFAGEVAQYGFSETMRTEGIVKAFKAAMAAGDFKAGRYFVARYGPTAVRKGLVTQDMYDAEEKKRYDALAPAASAPQPPAAHRKSKRKPRRRPACPKYDWCVGEG